MQCKLCERSLETLTLHHLVPRQHSKRRHTDPGPTIAICGACHRQIHTLFDNRTLANDLNTVDKLKQHPDFSQFLAWVGKQDPTKRVRVHKRRS